MSDEKKRPGRPRKYAIVPTQSCGIVDKPVNDENIVEMTHHDPLMFKKLFNLFGTYGCVEIIIVFMPDKVVMVSCDHHGKTYIRETIDGNKLNYYYCPSEVRVAIKRSQIEKIVNTLDKSHHKITFILKENFRSTMYIVIRDIAYDNDDMYEVELIDANTVAVDVAKEIDVADYPIKFQLDSAHFKKKIVDISKLSTKFSFIKNGGDPLSLTYEGQDRITCTITYSSPEKISLISNISDDDMFSVSVYVGAVSPFAKNHIGNMVSINIDKYKPICFGTTVLNKDGAGDIATLEVYTEILSCDVAAAAVPT